jgi:hypothetical protein
MERPLTAREAFELARKRSDPRLLAAIQERIDSGKLSLDEDRKPDVIVGGAWPTPIMGAQRFNCSRCNKYVALTPRSGAVVAERFPDLPIICLNCLVARESVDKDAKP